LGVFKGLKNSKKMIREIQDKLETIAENMHNLPEVQDIY
jgi:hypothetical protein